MIQIDSSSLIISDNTVHGLTVKEHYCPEALSYHPCDFCSLQVYCVRDDPQLCTTFGATDEEFYVECGVIEVDRETHRLQAFPLAGFQFV